MRGRGRFGLVGVVFGVTALVAAGCSSGSSGGGASEGGAAASTTTSAAADNEIKLTAENTTRQRTPPRAARHLTLR